MATVAVVGLGAVGAVFAAALQTTGRHQITLCSRRQLTRHVEVEFEGRDRRELCCTYVNSPQECVVPVDWVLLSVKSHQVTSTRPWLKALCGPNTVVVILQNGIDHCRLVAPLIADVSLLPAIIWSPAEQVDPYTVLARAPMQASVPEAPEGYEFAALMTGSGASISVIPDFHDQAWAKLCMNAVAGLMAVTASRAGLFRHASMQDLTLRLATECAAVGRADGARLPINLPERIVADLVSMSPEMGTSILFDRMSGRPLEWEARNGVIQKLGRIYGVATPVSDVIVPILEALSGSRHGH
jgi:2-dehydropantoate 2-reductase